MEYDREFLTAAVGGLDLEPPVRIRLQEGALYPAVHHMERAGLLSAAWRESAAGRPRKYYSLTAKGRRRAESKRRQWAGISAAMRAIVGDTHA